MRWICATCLVLAVASIGASCLLSDATANEEAAPKPAEVAAWIRTGEVAALERAAEAAKKLNAEQLRMVICEVRDQTRIEQILGKKMIQGLTWNNVNLDAAVAYLQTITGLNYYVTPKVRTEMSEDIAISLQIDKASVRTVLDLITTPYGLVWGARGGIVYLMTTEESGAATAAAAPKEDGAAKALRAKIKATTVSLSLDKQSFPQVVKALQIQTGFNIVIDPRISAHLQRVTVSEVALKDTSFETVLNMIVEQGGAPNVTWTVQGNVILITGKEFLQRK